MPFAKVKLFGSWLFRKPFHDDRAGFENETPSVRAFGKVPVPVFEAR